MDLAFDSDWENDTVVNQDVNKEAATLEQGSYVGEAPAGDLAERRRQNLADAWSDLRDRALCEGGAIDSWDVSIKAAAETLAARVADVAHSAGLLARVSSSDIEDSHVVAYVAGAYLWLDGVVATLTSLAAQLGEMNPNWALFRERLHDIEWIYDLTQREQDETPAHCLPDRVAGNVRQLFAAIAQTKTGLDERFG